MGGASSVIAAAEDPLIKGLVVDSAFGNMRKLANELG
jgi:hypothetical protein